MENAKFKKTLRFIAALVLIFVLGTTLLSNAASANSSEQPEPGDSQQGSPAPGSEPGLGPDAEQAAGPEPNLAGAEDGAHQLEPDLSEPDETGTPALAADQLDDSSVVVYTYSELREALGNSNGFTTIYLGNDIVADSATGVSIAADKAAVVIDGCPPGAPAGTRHTFTQYQSAALSATIRVDSTASKTRAVTLQNIVINGKNLYGVVSVATNISGVAVIYNNADYTGPQLVYNRAGTARFIGGSYTLQTTGGNATGELAEALYVEMGGAITISVASSANAVLWLTGSDSSLVLLPGADVSLTTANYFIYTSGYFPSVSLGQNAKLSVVDKLGFTYADQRISTFLLETGSALYIEQNSTQSFAALRVSSAFKMQPGSSATIIRTGVAGIALRLTNPNAVAEFNEPNRVFLYSSAGVPLRFTAAGTLTITTSALNAWEKSAWPVLDSLDNMPSHIWNKSGEAALSVKGTYYEATNQSLTHNLGADDPNTTPLNAQNFNLEKNQLIAFGAIKLAIDAPTTLDTAIRGSATPGAAISAVFTPGGETAQSTTSGFADGAGDYSIATGKPALALGSAVVATANADRLKMRQSAVVSDGGSGILSFLSVPDRLSFGSLEIPSSPTLANRFEPDFVISVGDNRLNSPGWRLDVSIPQPLRAGEHVLTNALVYKSPGGGFVALGADATTVYRQSDGAPGSYDIGWGEGDGLLLNLYPGEIYSGAEYSATIHWTLIDAP